ncbi:MAG: hypothetical protein HQL38_19495 [Alphaproteobacteria bacterium]|nr:hypothetical protein [Alphaproteobacteria bacterium]
MISTIEGGREDMMGMSPGEVLWLRDHLGDDGAAKDLASLYERAIHDPDAREEFDTALLRFRDSDAYTEVLMRMFSA